MNIHTSNTFMSDRNSVYFATYLNSTNFAWAYNQSIKLLALLRPIHYGGCNSVTLSIYVILIANHNCSKAAWTGLRRKLFQTSLGVISQEHPSAKEILVCIRGCLFRELEVKKQLSSRTLKLQHILDLHSVTRLH